MSSQQDRPLYKHWETIACLFLGCVFFMIWVGIFGFDVRVVPDSTSYIAFGQKREVGYPLFLSLIKALFGSYTLLPLIQFSLYTAAAVYLALSCKQLLNTRISHFLIVLMLLANPSSAKMMFSILSEGIYFPLIFVFMGTLARYIGDQKLSQATLLVCLATAIFLTRSIGIISILALPAIFYFSPMTKRGLFFSCAALATALMLSLLIDSSATFLKHKTWSRGSRIGHQLIGKVAFVGLADQLTNSNEFAKHATAIFAPIKLATQEISSVAVKYRALSGYYDIMRYHVAPRLIEELGHNPEDFDQQAKSIAINIIWNNPTGYVQEVIQQYVSHWYFPDLLTSHEVTLYQDFYAKNKQILMGFKAFPHLTKFPNLLRDVLVYGLRGSCALVFVVTLLIPFLYLRKLGGSTETTHALFFATILSLLVHATFLITSLIQLASPRYVMASFPALLVFMLSSFCVAYSFFQRKQEGNLCQRKHAHQ